MIESHDERLQVHHISYDGDIEWTKIPLKDVYVCCWWLSWTIMCTKCNKLNSRCDSRGPSKTPHFATRHQVQRRYQMHFLRTISRQRGHPRRNLQQIQKLLKRLRWTSQSPLLLRQIRRGATRQPHRESPLRPKGFSQRRQHKTSRNPLHNQPRRLRVRCDHITFQKIIIL